MDAHGIGRFRHRRQLVQHHARHASGHRRPRQHRRRGSRLNAQQGPLTLRSASSTGSLLVQSGGLVSVGANVHIDGAVSLGAGSLTAGGALTLDLGSSITGQGVLSATAIVDMGRLGTNAGTMTCIGNVSGAGQLTIGGGGHLVLQGSDSAGITFTSGGGTLIAVAPGALAGAISAWSVGDAIDLTGTAATQASFAGHALSLFDASNHLLGTLTFAGTLTTQNFAIGHDAGAGVLISFHG